MNTPTRLDIVGYLVSLVVVCTLYFTLDTKLSDFLAICFFAWTGGYFFKALKEQYNERKLERYGSGT